MLNIKLHLKRNGYLIFSITCLSSLFISFFILTTLHNHIGFNVSTTNVSENTQFTNTCIINECSIEQSKKHGELFASFKPDWSVCYADLYLKALDNHETSVHILIDVGANKAYTVASWFAFFLPELDINQVSLGRYLSSSTDLTESCGSCNDCQDELLRKNNTQQKLKLQIHAFEPQPATVEVLKNIKKWINISERSESIFKIHGMAVSDYTGRALFKKCNAGNEVCSLDVSGVSTNDQVQVDAITLDEFANHYHLSKIDILKIGTEGYEPFVFRGAKRLLEEHRIRLFIFEHLQEGAWRNTSLQTEVLNLSKLGYVCYIIGKTGVLRVSNCWNEKFNVRHNNLLCISSRDIQLLYNIDQMRLIESVSIDCKKTSKR